MIWGKDCRPDIDRQLLELIWQDDLINRRIDHNLIFLFLVTDLIELRQSQASDILRDHLPDIHDQHTLHDRYDTQ